MYTGKFALIEIKNFMTMIMLNPNLDPCQIERSRGIRHSASPNENHIFTKLWYLKRLTFNGLIK